MPLTEENYFVHFALRSPVVHISAQKIMIQITDNYYLGGIVYILYDLLLFLQWASTSCKNEGNQGICSTAHLQPTCSALAVCWWYNRCPGLGGSWWQANSFHQGIIWRGKTSCQTHSRWDEYDTGMSQGLKIWGDNVPPLPPPFQHACDKFLPKKVTYLPI